MAKILWGTIKSNNNFIATEGKTHAPSQIVVSVSNYLFLSRIFIGANSVRLSNLTRKQKFL